MKNVNKLKLRKVKSVTNPLMKGLLKTALATGLIGVVITAPNSLQALDLLVKKLDKTKKRGKRFNEYARRSGYFEVESCGKDRYAIKLSSKGQKAAQNVLFDDFTLTKAQKWDGSWHILMFDIGEKHKYLRDMLSNKVTDLGMLPLQNSVYVYPYAFDDFIENLHIVYPQAMQYVMSARATQIDGEKQLIEKFRLAKVI